MNWWKKLLVALEPQDPDPDRQRALDLIAAVDAGGLPLNPARVNDIGRRLGCSRRVHPAAQRGRRAVGGDGAIRRQ